MPKTEIFGRSTDIIDRGEPCLLAKMSFCLLGPSEESGYSNAVLKEVSFARGENMREAADTIAPEKSESLVNTLATGYVARVLMEADYTEYHVLPYSIENEALDHRGAIDNWRNNSLSGRIPDGPCTIGAAFDGESNSNVIAEDGDSVSCALDRLPEELSPQDIGNASAHLLRFGAHRCGSQLYVHLTHSAAEHSVPAVSVKR